jgi:nitrate/nitrite transporter NarK
MEKNLHKRITAIAMLLLFLTSSLVRELHPFFAEEHQHVQKICDEKTKQTHFHSSDYAGVHCSFCAISLAVSDYFDISYHFTMPTFRAFSEIISQYSIIFIALDFPQPYFRGPPQA